MDYQQLPPVSTMNIGPPTPAPSPHIQVLQNSSNNSQQILPSMQPPQIPLQVVHNNNNSQQLNHHNLQNLPPPSQLLQLHHLNSNNNNNNNNTTNNNNNEEGNRWTQYQVQQLWRHHAYLNGKAIIKLFLKKKTIKSCDLRWPLSLFFLK